MGVFDSAGQINQDIVGATMVGIGLIVTFFGAKFFKYIVFFIGFCFGALVTYYAVPIFFAWFDVEIAEDTLLYMSLTVGAVCGILLVVIYKVAVFTCGAVCGAIFSQIVWIAVVSNINAPDEDWMSGVQIAVLVVCAILGGFLAFKFVQQVLKGVTAFIGGFMFASGIAYFIGRIDSSENNNVIDWVVFFGSYTNYTNLTAVCDAYCIVCILLWVIMFAAGCFVQYKLHKKHKKKDHESSDSDSDSSDNDSDDSDSSHKSSKKKKKRKRKHSSGDDSDDGQRYEHAESQYGGYAPSSYAGSQYGRAPNSVHSASQPGGRNIPVIAPTVAMSNYGANYVHGGPGVGPGVNTARSSQYGTYGQRNQVQYV